MYYIPNVLTTRSNGNLAKCWLAGTLSRKQLRKLYQPRIIDSINVVDACNEIEASICSNSNLSEQRYSLYLAAQLTFGAIRIHQEQLQNVDKMLEDLEAQLRPPNLKKLNKKKALPPEQEFELVQIPSLPPLPDVLFPAELPPDRFQLTEDLPLASSDFTFGNLDMPIGQPFGDLTDTALFRTFRDYADDLSAEHLLENTTNITDYENLSEAPIFGAIDAPMTPKKRPRSNGTVDTPSKRPRKTAPLIDELPPPEPLPVETAMVNLPDMTEGVPVLPEASEIIENSEQVPERPPSEAETLILDVITDNSLDLPPKTPRKRLFQDKFKTISTAVMKRRLENVTVATAPQAKIDLAYVRHSMLPTLTVPSTSWRARGSHIWNQRLRTTFNMRIQGPFYAEYDADNYPENIRHPNATTSSGLTLTSDNIIQGSQLADDTGKSIVDILPIEHANETRGIPDLPADMPELPIMEVPVLPQLDPSEVPEVPDVRPPRGRVSSGTTDSGLVVDVSETPRFLDNTMKIDVELDSLRQKLKNLWQQGQEVVKFDVLVPRATNTVMDASICLSKLACLAQNNEIKLLQAKSHDDIWIQKFFTEFDENSD